MSVTVELWYDSGYTEDSVERPKLNSTLSSPDITINNVNPSKDRYFSEFQLKQNYESLLKCSYLRATYDFHNGNDITLYGWIDSVRLQSDSSGYPITVVSWHIDYWRTYKNQAEFKDGIVTRRPSSAVLPPQNYPFRLKRATNKVALVTQRKDYNNNPLWWVFLTYTAENEEHTVTNEQFICFPLSTSSELYVKASHQTSAALTPNLEAFTGSWDELLGLMPSRVKGVWLSPLAPDVCHGDGSYSDPLYMDHWRDGISHRSGTHTYGAFVNVGSVDDDGYPIFGTFGGYLPSVLTADDTKDYVITGFEGERVGAIPWGFSIREYYYRHVIESNHAYIQYRFNTDNELYSHVEGLCFTIPLIALELCENSWSEYNYSGQREYDLQMRNLNTDKALVGGLTSAVGSAGFGAIGGGGPAAGAAIGLLSAAGSLVNYAANKEYFNPETQKWEDYGHAVQSDGFIMPGGGSDSFFHGQVISLVEMKKDDYSLTQRSNDIALYGAHVQEPTANCTSLIASGGPLQIENLVVKGSIPPEAKTAIRVLFAQGVRLV